MTSTQDKREKKLAKQIKTLLGPEFVSHAHALAAARGETEVLAPTEELRDALLALGVKSKLGAPKRDDARDRFEVMLHEKLDGEESSFQAGYAFSLDKAKEIGAKRLKKHRSDGHPNATMTVRQGDAVVYSSEVAEALALVEEQPSP